MFISIEGIDGTGKSTVTKLLAEKIGCTAISTPPEVIKEIRSQYDGSQSAKARYYFYLSGLYLLDEKIRNLMTLGHLICDRHIHSTLAYQYPIDEHFPVDINKLFTDIQKPDKTILLTTDNVIRKSRMLSRMKVSGIENSIADYNYDMQELALSRFLLMPNLIHIDTTYCDASTVCDKIFNLLKIDLNNETQL
jgi:thymidylate kinase